MNFLVEFGVVVLDSSEKRELRGGSGFRDVSKPRFCSTARSEQEIKTIRNAAKDNRQPEQSLQPDRQRLETEGSTEFSGFAFQIACHVATLPI